jgi:TATA-binding protein-associated factor
MAARLIRSHHRLILTGTPVQNRVNELWATFDFLMPNFLGSHSHFSKVYGNPIGRGQQPGASAHVIQSSMDKLKLLHQQVLPFILRREKDQVLKELPPKCITDMPCFL